MLIEEYKAALAEEKAAKKKVAQLKAKILEEHRPNIEYGTAHFDGFDIVISKKVDWCQEKLQQLFCNYNFIRAKYDINETLYKSLPDEIKTELEDARTVKQGTITIKIKDEE